MEVSGQPHATAALPRREVAGIRTLDRPARSQSRCTDCAVPACVNILMLKLLYDAVLFSSLNWCSFERLGVI
jgi:hypothetical protein